MMGIVVVLLIGIGVIVQNIVGLTIEKRALQDQNAELTEKRDELTAELQNVNDPDYIEEQARKLLHMIKPGEVLYILNGSGHPSQEGGESELALPTRPDAPTSEEVQAEENAQSEEVAETEGVAEETTEETYETEERYQTEETYETEETYSEEQVDDGSEG